MGKRSMARSSRISSGASSKLDTAEADVRQIARIVSEAHCLNAPDGSGRDRRRPGRSWTPSTARSPRAGHRIRIAAWPSHARSVVDSPGPDADRHRPLARADWLPRNRRNSALPMVMLLADRLTSSSAPASRAARRRHRPDVFADRHGRSGTLPVERNNKSVPNGCSPPARSRSRHAGARCNAVSRRTRDVRQVGLGHHADDPAAMDDDRGVVEPAVRPERSADDQHRVELARGLDEPGDRALDLVEERILQQQVVDRVGREPELGEDHQDGAGPVAFLGQPQRLRKVVGGVGHPGSRHAAGYAGELVRIE